MIGSSALTTIIYPARDWWTDNPNVSEASKRYLTSCYHYGLIVPAGRRIPLGWKELDTRPSQNRHTARVSEREDQWVSREKS